MPLNNSTLRARMRTIGLLNINIISSILSLNRKLSLLLLLYIKEMKALIYFIKRNKTA